MKPARDVAHDWLSANGLHGPMGVSGDRETCDDRDCRALGRLVERVRTEVAWAATTNAQRQAYRSGYYQGWLGREHGEPEPTSETLDEEADTYMSNAIASGEAAK